MISKSLEEYLKTMYVLKKQNGNIRVTDIANKMKYFLYHIIAKRYIIKITINGGV